MTRRLIVAVFAWVISGSVMGAGGAMQLMDAAVDLSDRASLQSGARTFVNYCMGCHSMKYMRYKRMGEDLGLSDEQVADNLMFAADKVVEPMNSAMTVEDGERWFGKAPPDLSVIARSRGADWLYTYLVTFYADSNPSRPFGVNNVAFPAVGMPHVLWPLQGYQTYLPAELDGELKKEQISGVVPAGDEILVNKTVTVAKDGTEKVLHVSDRLQVTQPGSMQPGEFRAAMRDLVAFLVYAGEPAQLKRYSMGIWVLLFLVVFFVVSRLLYKEYWKDVH